MVVSSKCDDLSLHDAGLDRLRKIDAMTECFARSFLAAMLRGLNVLAAEVGSEVGEWVIQRYSEVWMSTSVTEYI
jgi:hypothetical protein